MSRFFQGSIFERTSMRLKKYQMRGCFAFNGPRHQAAHRECIAELSQSDWSGQFFLQALSALPLLLRLAAGKECPRRWGQSASTRPPFAERTLAVAQWHKHGCTGVAWLT